MIKHVFSRHLAALLITIGVYFIPVGSIVSDEMYFQFHSLLSIAYALLIYKTKVREVPFLILIESISVIYTTICFIQWYLSLKSQWFYANFEIIMTVCFLAEIVVIMFGAAHGGVDRIISTVRQCRFYDDNRD